MRSGAATDVEIWDSTTLLDEDNAKIAENIEFGKKGDPLVFEMVLKQFQQSFKTVSKTFQQRSKVASNVIRLPATL